MKPLAKKIGFGLFFFVILLFGLLAYFVLGRLAPIGAGYKAKMLCSCRFVQNRETASILQHDLEPFNPLLKYVDGVVDEERKTVTSTAFGLVTRTAVFRNNLGCTLLPAGFEKTLPDYPGHVEPFPGHPEKTPWPMGDLDAVGPVPSEVDAGKLAAALDREFSEPDPQKPRRARAVVVVFQGNIIAERYAPGFTRDTPLHGWSMTKSITNALVGILVGEGKLNVDAPAAIQEWQAPGDPRGKITVAHLLRMSAGFDFHHDLNPTGQRQQSLFGGIDSVAHSVRCPLEVAPGTRWEYANANPHSLWRLIRDIAGKDHVDDYISFPRRALFHRIGMRSAVIEPDPYGNFIGTSFGWATARDWARFGLLYLNDGVWEGRRILPEGWVAYTRTPAPADPLKHYGALFWLNAGGGQNFSNISTTQKGERNVPPFARIPADAFFAVGHDGQRIAIIPSRDLVVVRLGLSRVEETWDYEGFLADILDAIGEPAAY
jgi:CubicO group peptidase (beta-lactamase class C family)